MDLAAEQVKCESGAKRGKDARRERKKRKRDNTGEGVPEPREGRCHFYIERKRKHCSHYATKGNFCNMHGGESDKFGKRVPCPVNPNHTVFESRLKKHMFICNEVKRRAELEGQPYFSKGMNASAFENSGEPSEVRLFDFDIHDQDKLILRLDDFLRSAGALSENLESFIEPEFPEEGFTYVQHGQQEEEEAEGDGDGEEEEETAVSKKGRQRHTVQEDAIIETSLRTLGLESFPSGTCIVEMGAGKGGLSLRFSNTMSLERMAYFVMVDRESAKHHKAPQILAEDNRRTEKVRIDIRDLDLWKVPLITEFVSKREEKTPLVMASKHLCGDATCFTLRCAVQGVRSSTATQNNRPDAIVIALCCHHRCTLEGYVNPNMILETLKMTPREFDMVRRMSSWATCAPEKRTEQQKQVETNGGSKEAFEKQAMEISDEERVRIGLKCKLLLNYGRLRFLRDHGFEANLVKFASKSTTLENTLLVAWPSG